MSGRQYRMMAASRETVPRALAVSLLLLAGSAAAEDPVLAVGKYRAQQWGVDWDVRDVDHPVLGPVKFAVQKRAVTTAVPNDRIFSRVFMSCQRSTGKVAFELSNALESNQAGGLGPSDMPQLVCKSLRPEGDIAQKEVRASWEINDLGDALARGLSASELRRCVSIDVVENLALPPRFPQRSQPVTMEITPYSQDLDAVFVACGERSAYLPEESVAVAAAPRAAAPPAAPRAPERAAWLPARTVARGRTNVRERPTLSSPVVVQLDPGARVLVEQGPGDWWRVKQRRGPQFAGFVRKDRLELERAGAPGANQ